MSWILIAIVVLLAAFGPILWLKPSARDKRLTAIRARARAKNLSVDIKPFERLDPRPEQRVSAGGQRRDATELVALYRLILPQRLQRVSGFSLLRDPGLAAQSTERGAVRVDANWRFDPAQSYPPAAAWPESFEQIKELAAGLPDDVLALELTPRSVGVFWLESAGADIACVDQIAAILEQMGQALVALEDRLQASARDDDS